MHGDIAMTVGTLETLQSVTEWNCQKAADAQGALHGSLTARSRQTQQLRSSTITATGIEQQIQKRGHELPRSRPKRESELKS